MLVLPEWIEAKVVAPGATSVGQVLVAVSTLLNGGYYFGDLMGLTNEQGVVRITGEQLRRDFEANQKTFPMDFKIALEDCDAALDVIVRGGEEFRDLKGSIESSSLVRSNVKALYARARNEMFESTRMRLDLSGRPRRVDPVELVLDASLNGGV
jgi:hypothetical protein